MKTYKVFLYFFITLVLGSFMIGIVDFLFFSPYYSFSRFRESMLDTSGLALIISSIASIPGLIALLILNHKYVRRDDSSIRKALLYHALIGVVNFILFAIILSILFFSLDGWFIHFIIFFCYAPFGVLLWWMELRRMASKSS